MSVSEQALVDTARALVAPGKGLLAMDESTGTCNRRFAEFGIAPSEENRRRYRQLLVTAPGLQRCISGAILFDETLQQRSDDGTPLVRILQDAGIVPGIKVDAGAQPLAGHAGEHVTEGLDGLRQRLQRHAEQGARFAKWRAVLDIGEGTPSRAAIEANAHALARYAALCQECGLVPIVEPEVLMDGAHTLQRCREVSAEVLHQVFAQLHRQQVVLEAMLLKPNMVVPGLACTEPASAQQVAEHTLQVLRRAVPAAVAGIAFLSGGQSAVAASAHLQAMHHGGGALPWPLTFSFARALQQPALQIWRGDDANRSAAQQALLHRAGCNAAAVRGAYSPAMESRPA